jgi:hypothetical protein
MNRRSVLRMLAALPFAALLKREAPSSAPSLSPVADRVADAPPETVYTVCAWGKSTFTI